MKIVIGIIGGAGAGKDVAGEFISQLLAIPKYEISQTIKYLAIKEGIDPIRKNLILYGAKLSRQYGFDYLAKVLLDKIDTIGVMTGMRLPAHIKYLRNNSKLILIAISAASAVRFTRIKDRGKYGEVNTLEAFLQEEQWENAGDNVQRLFECMAMADYTVVNEGKIDMLYNELRGILVKEKLL